MIWDDFLDDGSSAAATAPDDRPLVPDGTHVGTVAWSGYQSKEWAKSTANAEGKTLTVKIDLGPTWRPLWDSIPCQQIGRVRALCSSARVDAPARGVEWDVESLKGQTVTVETVTAVAKSGRDYVKATAYKPGQGVPPTPAPKRERPKSAADKAMDTFKANAGDDDIPF